MRFYRVGKHYARVPLSRFDRMVAALLGFRITRDKRER